MYNKNNIPTVAGIDCYIMRLVQKINLINVAKKSIEHRRPHNFYATKRILIIETGRFVTVMATWPSHGAKHQIQHICRLGVEIYFPPAAPTQS